LHRNAHPVDERWFGTCRLDIRGRKVPDESAVPTAAPVLDLAALGTFSPTDTPAAATTVGDNRFRPSGRYCDRTSSDRRRGRRLTVVLASSVVGGEGSHTPDRKSVV
jgi:hypothetical protein